MANTFKFEVEIISVKSSIFDKVFTFNFLLDQKLHCARTQERFIFFFIENGFLIKHVIKFCVFIFEMQWIYKSIFYAAKLTTCYAVNFSFAEFIRIYFFSFLNYFSITFRWRVWKYRKIVQCKICTIIEDSILLNDLQFIFFYKKKLMKKI